MKRTDKIKLLESYEYKVIIKPPLFQIVDSIDDNGFSITDKLYFIDSILNDVIYQLTDKDVT